MHCAHFEANRCRSCNRLPTPYAAQLAAKDTHCREVLSAYRDIRWLEPVASSERGFRNKAKMVVGGSAVKPVLGIVGPSGQDVDLSDCPLYPIALQESFAPLKAYIAAAGIAPYAVTQRRGELKFVIVTVAPQTNELMARFVLRSQEPMARMRKHLPQLLAALPRLVAASVNIQPEHKAVLEGTLELPLTDDPVLTMRINGLPLHLRPQSFFQTNSEIAAALYARAREWTDELWPTTIWDLYCGVGGFALHCADPQRRIVGIESSAEAIASAQRSRDELGLQTVDFVCADATSYALAQPAWPDLVIVNPPRRGLSAPLCAALQASTTRAVLYSSCNVESLARDLAAMPTLVPRRAQVLDMFPHTDHYEVLTLLQRVSPDGANA